MGACSSSAAANGAAPSHPASGVPEPPPAVPASVPAPVSAVAVVESPSSPGRTDSPVPPPQDFDPAPGAASAAAAVPAAAALPNDAVRAAPSLVDPEGRTVWQCINAKDTAPLKALLSLFPASAFEEVSESNTRFGDYSWYDVSPLHYAVVDGCTEAAQLLIDARINLARTATRMDRARDYGGYTPLMFAAQLQRLEIAHSLLAAGADAAAEAADGSQAIHFCVSQAFRDLIKEHLPNERAAE